MNNPFSRLKHYLPIEHDSQENHATECLAVCLVFSERMKKSFIQFLAGNDVKLGVEALSKVVKSGLE